MKRVWYLSLWLVGVLICIFALQQILPYRFSWQVGSFEPQFFISMLSHGSIGHLLGNIFALIVFGLIAEGVIGSKRVAYTLISAGIIANLAAIGNYSYILGISGAVYGILGVLAVLRPKMIVWISGLPAPMILAALAWTFVDILGVFSNTNTAHLAHLLGIIVGSLYGVYLRKEFPPKKKYKKKFDPLLEKQLDVWEKHHMP